MMSFKWPNLPTEARAICIFRCLLFALWRSIDDLFVRQFIYFVLLRVFFNGFLLEIVCTRDIVRMHLNNTTNLSVHLFLHFYDEHLLIGYWSRGHRKWAKTPKTLSPGTAIAPVLVPHHVTKGTPISGTSGANH